MPPDRAPPTEAEIKRPLPHGLAELANLGRLPDWLAWEEVFSLWYPRHRRNNDPELRVAAKADTIRINEGIASGQLRIYRQRWQRTVAAPSNSFADIDPIRGWRGDSWGDEFGYDRPRSRIEEVETIWIRREDFAAWLHSAEIDLPEWSPLRAWLKPAKSNAADLERAAGRRGGRPPLVKGAPLDELKQLIADDEAAGRKSNASAHCRAVAERHRVNASSLRKALYESQ